MLKILSSGVRSLPHLKSFLAEELAQFADPIQLQAVAGWGHKATADKARALAASAQVPYIALEDGMLRSLDLGVNGAAPLSLSVDPCGCYYDASSASLLEKLLAEPDWFKAEDNSRAEKFLSYIRLHALSKYNCAPAFDPAVLKNSTSSRVLLVDQCAGDASLQLGLCPENAAEIMLQRAQELYGDAELYLQVHPDVLAGRRKGLFDLSALPSCVTVLSEAAAPFTLLPHFKALFTVSSQLGFEGLLQGGITVHCLGMPFYAGYGLTADEQVLERRAKLCAARRQPVSVQELTAAVYFRLCRYVNPVTGRRCSAEEAAEILACQRQVNEANRGLKVVYGVRRWKHPVLQAFLHSTAGEVRFAADKAQALSLCEAKNGTLVQWASKRDSSLLQQAHDRSIKTISTEDGFIRSRGLGSSHFRPYSLVFDAHGIYYDSGSPSDLEDILNQIQQRGDFAALCGRAKRLISYLVQNDITKYNVGSVQTDVLERLGCMASRQERILVPGQVEDDASVRASGGTIRSNAQLLQAVRKDNPEAFIVYKPHPDVLSLNRSGIEAEKACMALADLTVTDCSISSLYSRVDRICVLSSQSGFEALLRSRKVTVYGRPFYAGWGLTEDKQRFEHRHGVLSIEALAAGVLLLYPRYFDWQSGMFCRAEDVCWRLEHMEEPPADSLWVRLVRASYQARRNVWRFLHGDFT